MVIEPQRVKIAALFIVFLASAAVGFAQSPSVATRPLQIVVFTVNPDVSDFTQKDVDLAMKNMVEGMWDTKRFSSIVIVRHKAGLSNEPGLLLEGVVTKFDKSNLGKILTYGIGATQTTLHMTFKLTDKVSGGVLMQKEFTSRGTKKNGLFAGDWSAASTQMAILVRNKVKKVLKK